MSDLSALEHSTLKVPYEFLNKHFRTAQKTIDRESSHVQHMITALEKLFKNEPVYVNDDISTAVRTVIGKLQLLRNRVGTTIDDEVTAVSLLRSRVKHLESGLDRWTNTTNNATLDQWSRKRVDRLVVDFLLRAGLYESASRLALQSDVSYLTNQDVFLAARRVEESLRLRSLGECLDWTKDNKSKLRRLKSRLELTARRQEFVELIRADKRGEAVIYARKWFGGAEEEGWKGDELRRTMGLLVVDIRTPVVQYRYLLSADRWNDLIALFRDENIRLYQLTEQSVFSACFQCGLSALKTPHCAQSEDDDEGARGKDCPVCEPIVNTLSAELPFAHASHSRLVCAYSGHRLDEHNPPMMLPNGMVYGQDSIHALESNGQVVCPRSGFICQIADVVRVYVM